MTYFSRIITAAIRICSQCEDEIPEGSIAFRSKNIEIWCQVCVDYEQGRPTYVTKNGRY